MKEISNQALIIAYVSSNIVGLLILLLAAKKPKVARIVFALLFGGACYVNLATAAKDPGMYVSYASSSIPLYAHFINGWFKDHVSEMVSCIAIGQAMIAVGMLLNKVWVKLACVGVIIFLAGIAPLGIGSAFPFSITVSVAAWLIIRRDGLDYIWKRKPSAGHK